MKVETTLIRCLSCETAHRVIGKNGTSISYMEYCPACGSGGIATRTEIIDLMDPDAEVYGSYQ